ncbi:MAG: LicD family protein [Bacteroides sp.]|nr:LicD family protein [Bacteroides sp.]
MNTREFNLNAEERCGFWVSEKRKKVWAVELEILREFIRICKKHNLSYYAIGGTLLGAVRHKGFIPWDDDVDVIMPRKDYIQFMQIAPKEIGNGFWVQTYETDKHYCAGQFKVCKFGTTCISPSLLEYDYPTKRYIFIDVFALDVIPDLKFKRALHKRGRNFFAFLLGAYMHEKMPVGKKKTPYNFLKFQVGKVLSKLLPVDKVYKWSMQFLGKYDKTDNANVGEVEFLYEGRFIWNRSYFANAVSMPFEDLMIDVPAGYEAVLDKTYGDWQTFVQGGSFHDGNIFDPDKDYTYYLQHREALKSVSEL